MIAQTDIDIDLADRQQLLSIVPHVAELSRFGTLRGPLVIRSGVTLGNSGGRVEQSGNPRPRHQRNESH